MRAEFDIGGATIGDSILPEPALAALAAQRGGEPVRLYIGQEKPRSLYWTHPLIVLADEPCGRVIDPTPAFWAAQRKRSYFSTGFFDSLGIERRPYDRTTCKVFLPEFGDSAQWSDHVVLFPYAACGRDHRQPAIGWWRPIVEHLLVTTGDIPLCLGGPDDPPIPGTLPLQGLPLRQSAWLILTARLVITTDSWPSHVAGGRTGPTLLLSNALPDFFVKASDRVTVVQTDPKGPRRPEWPHGEVVTGIRNLLEG